MKQRLKDSEKFKDMINHTINYCHNLNSSIYRVPVIYFKISECAHSLLTKR